MTLSGENEEEFVIAVSERLDEIKDSIPQIETSDEARGFVIGSLGTLSYMSKRLLPSDIARKMDDIIEEQEAILAKMIERMKKME